MPTQTNSREQLTANRERDFWRYREFELSKNRLPGLVAAEAIINRPAIEQMAQKLLETHTAKENILPPQEYLDNARTALFEVLTASGHLSRIELVGTPEQVNAQVLNRLLNGITPNLPPHEKMRRFQELCEELYVQQVQALVLRGELPPDTEVLTISDYPCVNPGATTPEVRAFGLFSNAQALAAGYNPYNKKGMVRATSFEHKKGKFSRVVEQISRSNANQPEATIQFLGQQSVPVQRRFAADIDLLGTQVLYSRRDITEGVVGVQRRLDAFAGPNIMYGEAPGPETVGYEDLRTISAVREARVEPFAKELAAYEEWLDKQVINGNLTPADSAERYLIKVRSLVRQICVLDPRYAEAAFGMQAAAHYQAAAERMRAGDSQGASELVAAASSVEQAVVICGTSLLPHHLTASEQGDLLKALQQKQHLWQLRPMHNNDPNYLRRKYRLRTVPVDTCQACDRRRFVAECRICPGCDWEDTKAPGFIERTLKRKRQAGTLAALLDFSSEFKAGKIGPTAKKSFSF